MLCTLSFSYIIRFDCSSIILKRTAKVCVTHHATGIYHTKMRFKTPIMQRVEDHFIHIHVPRTKVLRCYSYGSPLLIQQHPPDYQSLAMSGCIRETRACMVGNRKPFRTLNSSKVVLFKKITNFYTLKILFHF